MTTPDLAFTRPRIGTRPTWLTASVAVVALGGLALRVLLALTTRSHAFDTETYRSWAGTLVSHPWSEFYSRATGPDHLPGDVVLHGVLGRGWGATGGDLQGPGYGLALKAVACAADAVIAVLVGLLAAPRIGAGRAARWALVAWCCPVLWLVSAWWGQWDAVGVAVLLGGIAVLDRAPTRWAAGVALLAWACVIKPQLALAAGPVVVAMALVPSWRSRPTDRRAAALAAARRAAGALAVGLVTVQLLCGPFSVGLVELGARWSLAERVAYAADRFHAMTLGAPNVWTFATPWWGDDARRFGPFTAAAWGSGLLVAGLVCAAGAWGWRHGQNAPAGARDDALPGALAWATVNLAGFYAVATRCHERYLLPAVVLAVALAALRPAARWRALALTLVLTGTLLHSLVGLGRGPGETWFLRGLALVLGAALLPLPTRHRVNLTPKKRG